MALWIQKFGGSSLATPERIKRVAHIVRRSRAQGHEIVVVVSAMQGETDRLIQLSREFSQQPDKREYAALVSTGEQVSSALLSMELNHTGIPARSLNATQIRLRTNNDYCSAALEPFDADVITQTLANQIVPVVTGFQGVDLMGNVTTLGRGGSDLTAVILAQALKADECQIFTDVAGVYTTDPNIVPEARLLPELSHMEMLFLARSGAKVLQVQSVEYATRYQVPLRVLSTFDSSTPGTLIKSQYEFDSAESCVSGIAFDGGQAKVSITGIPRGEQAAVWERLSEGFALDMLTSTSDPRHPDSHLVSSFSANFSEYQQIIKEYDKLRKEYKGLEVQSQLDMVKLSLVGRGMELHPRIASRVLDILSQAGISIELISSSAFRIATLIKKQGVSSAAQALHQAFGLETLPQIA